MQEHQNPSFPIQIFVAGDVSTAQRICREHTFVVGLCVTLSAADYVYTGGMEAGVVVGLINYPRFPATETELLLTARNLAHALLVGLSQTSLTIQTPTETIWITRRPE